MLKIKSLYLKNYAGFKGECNFDFARPDGTFKPINVFFGPNGCGKSTGLNAIGVLCRAKGYIKRDPTETNLLLRKMQFHPDYDPSYVSFTKYEGELEIKGTFWDGEKDYIVHVQDDNVVQNDFIDKLGDNCAFIDADHPMNMNKFQVPAQRVELFLELCRAIYGYPCFVEKMVASNGVEGNNKAVKNVLSAYANNIDKIREEKVDTGLLARDVYQCITSHVKEDANAFYQDLIIQKGDVRVHHKSMSAGEKKIATLLKNLCDPTVMDRSDIVMVDNIEMHVYFKRHVKMLDKILSCFPDKQFIVTTHSGIMIDHVAKAYGQDCLFDIPLLKGQLLLD